MPQLVAVALIGGVVWMAWRALKKEMSRIGAEMDAREKMNNSENVTRLRRDDDGVYRPSREE